MKRYEEYLNNIKTQEEKSMSTTTINSTINSKVDEIDRLFDELIAELEADSYAKGVVAADASAVIAGQFAEQYSAVRPAADQFNWFDGDPSEFAEDRWVGHSRLVRV